MKFYLWHDWNRMRPVPNRFVRFGITNGRVIDGQMTYDNEIKDADGLTWSNTITKWRYTTHRTDGA